MLFWGPFPKGVPTAENPSTVGTDSQSTPSQLRGHVHTPDPPRFQKKEGKGRDKAARKTFDFLICVLGKYLVSRKREGSAVSSWIPAGKLIEDSRSRIHPAGTAGRSRGGAIRQVRCGVIQDVPAPSVP